MIRKRFHLTQEGVREFQIELEDLLARRISIAEHLRVACELGGLAENAQYIFACQDQEKVESRITKLENVLSNAKVVKKPKNRGTVRLGSVVKLSDKNTSKEFQIVGTVEADPLQGKISDESPIGKVMLGKRAGDEIAVKTSIDTTIYRIVSIA